jgi:hypothetical protein
MFQWSWARVRCSAFAALAVVTAIVVSGCAASHSAGQSTLGSVLAVSPPAVSAPPKLSTVRGLALPIQAYIPPAAEQDVISDATETLIVQCMSRYGFTWNYQPSHTVDVNQADREIGVSDLATAQQYGYSLPPADGGAAGGGPQAGHNADGTGQAGTGQAGTGGTMPAAEVLVLSGGDTGASASYQGQQVPEGGCAGQARRTVTGVDEIDPTALVASIQVAMWHKALSDSRLVNGFKYWSACMSQAGYQYASPLDAAGDPRWPSSGATQTEIQTAVADVRCKQRTNLIGVWYSIESGYEKEAIQHDIQQLTTIRQLWNRAAAKAAQMLGVPVPQAS